MKDFTLFGLILGIVAILGIGVGEQLYIEKVSKDMSNNVLMAEKVFFTGNLENSINSLQNAMEKWEKHKKLLQIMLNHEEVNKISEALIEIDSKLKHFSGTNNVSSNFALLKEYIINMQEGNKFTVNNVL